MKSKFDGNHIKTYSISQLEDCLDKFTNIFEQICEENHTLFKVTVVEIEENAEKFYNLSNVYITRIQNTCLNPIIYRLNELKANKSIRIGRISIIVGVLIAIITSIFSYCQSSKSSLSTKNEINYHFNSVKQADSLNFKTILKTDSSIAVKIDTIKKELVKKKGKRNKG